MGHLFATLLPGIDLTGISAIIKISSGQTTLTQLLEAFMEGIGTFIEYVLGSFGMTN